MLDDFEIDKILDELRISPAMMTADFGTGPGRWAMKLSRRVPKGIVYAIDIQESYLSVLEGKAKQEYLENIRFLKRDLTAPKGSGLPDNSINIIILANILFQSENQESILREAYRVLKKRGKALLIDWRDDNPIVKRQEFVSPDEIENMAEKAGFRIIKELEPDDYHFGFILSK